MFSNIFGKKEEWMVKVITPFTDTYLGMAYDEHHREVPTGETGKATISSKGHCVVTLDNVKDAPYDKPLKLYFTKTDEMYNRFTWTK